MFGSFSTADADRAHNKLSSGDFLKMQDGSNVIRIIPPFKGQSLPWVEVHQHFVKFPDQQKPVVFNCPKLMGGGSCPACDKAEQLSLSGNPNDQKNAKEFEPGYRAFCYAVNRKEPEKGIQPFAFGKSILKRLIEFRRNPDLGGGDFTHPKTGKDIIITKTGAQMGTRYQTDLGAQRPLCETDDQLMEWLDNVPDEGLQGFAKVLPLATIVTRLQEAAGSALETARTTQSALPSSSIDAAMGQTPVAGGAGPNW